MIKPDVIPENEPIIDVGIILPEDSLASVHMTIPEKPAYQLRIGDTYHALNAGELTLTFDHNTLHLLAQGMEWSHTEEIAIEPVDPAPTPAPESGILIDPVIAGRGFHWQKQIRVFLPDSIRFRIHDNHLICINSLPLEHYVMCVATSEMGADCPQALLEAQTIAARSWLLANIEKKHRAMGMDVCNDDCCQRYQGTSFLTPHSIAGALSTSGQVLMYGDAICDARYSKSCGGMMESADAVWVNYHKPYMVVKPDAPKDIAVDLNKLDLTREHDARQWIDMVPQTWCGPAFIPEGDLIRYLGSVDEDGAYFRWQVTVTQEELCKNLRTYAGIRPSAVLSLLTVQRGGSGRIIKLDIVYYSDSEHKKQRVHTVHSEYIIRRILSQTFLYSSAFRVEYRDLDGEIPGKFIFHGAGWGHGAGLCQIGALGMALHGKSTDEILIHYFPNTYIKKIY